VKSAIFTEDRHPPGRLASLFGTTGQIGICTDTVAAEQAEIKDLVSEHRAVCDSAQSTINEPS
jgi:hypothetical protein